MSAAEATNKVKILMVDDQPRNLLALEAVLGRLGQELVWAHSGEDALRRLLKDDYALLLLDVNLPGISGFELADMLRQRDKTRELPIIFISGISKSDAEVQRGYELGATDYVLKPFVPEILRAKVANIVEQALSRQARAAASSSPAA